ncbi:MAG: Mth938-like domain-containing protein [Halorhodospira sp.]
MKLAQDHGTASYRIRAYEPGWIQINRTVYERSVLLTPEQLSTEIQAQTLTELTAQDLAAALALEPELILLGTGVSQGFPERELIRSLISAGIGFEAMDTAAACRTFNVLMSEDRRVCTLLLLR